MKIFYTLSPTDTVGSSAYRLELSPEAAMHNVFHVNQLKLCPNPPTSAPSLSQFWSDLGASKEPEVILETKMAERRNLAVTKVLVQ